MHDSAQIEMPRPLSLAKPYVWNWALGWIPGTPHDPSYGIGAGTLSASIEDLYKWDQALYTTQLINEQELLKMFTPGLGSFGYGFFVDTLEEYGQIAVGHEGSHHYS